MIDDSYTVSLLHFDGGNNSSVFVDESGKTWTARASAVQSTDAYKFGITSGYFTDSRYIDTPDHADFDIGSGNFTIDFWVWRIGINARQMLCGQCDAAFGDASFTIEFQLNNTVLGQIISGATGYTATSTATITSTTSWNHLALVRNGNNLNLYINGTGDGTDDVTGVTATNSSSVVSIGRSGAYNGLYSTAYIDEFRFSKNIARWTANFTPPTSAYAPGGSQAVWFFLKKTKTLWDSINGLYQPKGMTI
jgi:hypothetical protein